VSWDKVGNSGTAEIVETSVRARLPGKEATMNDSTVSRLNALDEEYTYAVNAAIEEDREDVVRQLAAEYPDAAAEIMRAEAA
jgi:hypothetical protein